MDPLSLIVIAVAGLGAYFYASKSSGGSGSTLGVSGSTAEPDKAPFSLLTKYPDCRPEDQGGNFDTTYDDIFDQVRGEIGSVPFALMKAHAIRESSLNPKASLLEPTGKMSYGLMQVLWWKNSNRFANYGYSDDQIADGSLLFDPLVNVRIAARIIDENLTRFGNLRDAINAYNTGVAESKRVAPQKYVADVLKYYSTLVGSSIT